MTTPARPRIRVTTYHPEATDYVRRVGLVGAGVSPGTAGAVSRFCFAADRGGWRDRILRLNPMVGGQTGAATGLNACLVPLYRAASPTATPLGGATDTNFNFTSADYAETGANGGLLGDGTTKYLNTGFNVDQLPAASNCHLSAYIRGTQDITTVRAVIGALFNGVTDRYRLFVSSIGSTSPNFTIHSELGKAEQIAVVNRLNTNAGHLVSSRTGPAAFSVYDDGAAIGSNVNTVVETVGATPFLVFARTGPTEFYNGRIAGYSIGAGMTAAQVASFTAAFQAFQAALGRAV
jgi:hypothetical protein